MNAQSSSDGLVIVEIGEDPIEPSRTFTDKSTGMLKPLPARQTAYVWSGKRYPQEFKVDVPETGPRRPGLYLLAGAVFQPGKYGRLEFNDRALSLCPAGEAIAALQDALADKKTPLKAAS